jgi:AcrR family transcriptional regulator
MSMKHAGSEDPRVARTKRLLSDALMTLVAERPWDKVGVADICARAGVNRATFYAHYEDRNDLLERSMASLFDGMVDGADPSKPGTMEGQLLKLFSHCVERRDFYAAALAAGAPFRALFEEYLSLHAIGRMADLEPEEDDSDRALEARFGAGAILAALEWLLSDGSSCPAGKAAARVAALLSGGMGPKGARPFSRESAPISAPKS